MRMERRWFLNVHKSRIIFCIYNWSAFIFCVIFVSSDRWQRIKRQRSIAIRRVLPAPHDITWTLRCKRLITRRGRALPPITCRSRSSSQRVTYCAQCVVGLVSALWAHIPARPRQARPTLPAGLQSRFNPVEGRSRRRGRRRSKVAAETNDRAARETATNGRTKQRSLTECFCSLYRRRY